MLGNIQKVWDDYSGAGITVAVYDDGLEVNHADLRANYDASRHFTFAGRTYAPTPLASSDAHGTACAGLIAAVDNNGIGGTGVAHGARLTGMDYLNTLQNAYDWTTQTTSPLYDAAMRWAAGFHIMSNSWGNRPDYSAQLNLNNPGNASAVDAGHFAWVSANGRGGLGTLIVQAAGNNTLNANGDGSHVSRHTITVAATERNGFAAGYSNFGSAILVTAPAASVTTDLSGERGYNRIGSQDGDSLAQTDYTSTFSGTSAATPVVSGVIALMLDANEGLGWRDVQSILPMSARHTGSALGAAASATEVGTWATMGGTQWNGGGAIYHLSYGFGMVNAYAAVRMAEVWSLIHGAAHTSANETRFTLLSSPGGLQIRDSDGNPATSEAEISFASVQDISIESVQVRLNLDHSYSGDLRLVLRSPTGQLMTLFNRENGATDFDMTWTFAAEGFRGMSSLGTWTVLFHDDSPGDTGRIYLAQLDFFGSSNTVDDVYHFSDDFQMLLARQPGRGVIDDSNGGGADVLNFAAVSKTLSVNMAAGGVVRFDGVQVATLGSGTSDFERLFAGDGNDTISGNELDNWIYGGRGRDLLFGGAGNDRLFGEAGNNVMSGGLGNDTLTGSNGHDLLAGDAGNDVLFGGIGADTLAGGTWNDTMDGGNGEDRFIFWTYSGHDSIVNWVDNQDTMQLDDAIWVGGQTLQQVLDNYARVVGDATVIKFGNIASITLQGYTNIAGLLDDITIV